MSRKRRLALLVCGGLAGLCAVLLALLFAAARHVPSFYAQAVQLDAAAQADESHEFLVATTALASNAHRAGRWQALITAAQINGWLAVDRVENHPDLFAPEILEPRVAIEPGLAKLAFRFQDGNFNTVVSLELEVFLPEPNVVALRIHSARAGAIPIPLGDLLEKVTASATEAGVHLRWLETDGDPTAWITLPAADDPEDLSLRLDTLQLRDSAVFLSGETTSPDAVPSDLDLSAVLRSAHLGGADQSAGSSTHQR